MLKNPTHKAKSLCNERADFYLKKNAFYQSQTLNEKVITLIMGPHLPV